MGWMPCCCAPCVCPLDAIATSDITLTDSTCSPDGINPGNCTNTGSLTTTNTPDITTVSGNPSVVAGSYYLTGTLGTQTCDPGSGPSTLGDGEPVLVYCIADKLYVEFPNQIDWQELAIIACAGQPAPFGGFDYYFEFTPAENTLGLAVCDPSYTTGGQIDLVITGSP